jgi:hypothetical protein
MLGDRFNYNEDDEDDNDPDYIEEDISPGVGGAGMNNEYEFY